MLYGGSVKAVAVGDPADEAPARRTLHAPADPLLRVARKKVATSRLSSLLFGVSSRYVSELPAPSSSMPLSPLSPTHVFQLNFTMGLSGLFSILHTDRVWLIAGAAFAQCAWGHSFASRCGLAVTASWLAVLFFSLL